jgi:fructuronate reductase
MDGSQKIPQRWLDAALINLQRGRKIDATATALAAWIAYLRGNDGRGREWLVDDPLAAKLRRCHDATDAAQTVDSLLANREIFSESLGIREDFRTAIRRACQEALI